MSEPTDWYAPNQQSVRGDESGPAEEGEGGTERIDLEPQPTTDLDEMTKDELLQVARDRGVSPANAAMTKEEIRAAIDAA
jgi:hypothetical protein